MLTSYEYRILKEFSKYHSDYISISDSPYNPTNVDRIRLINLKSAIGKKTNIDNYLIESATAKFISDGYNYLNSHADVSNAGLTALYNYHRDKRKAFFNDTFFKIISAISGLLSIASIIISLIVYFKSIPKP